MYLRCGAVHSYITYVPMFVACTQHERTNERTPALIIIRYTRLVHNDKVISAPKITTKGSCLCIFVRVCACALILLLWQPPMGREIKRWFHETYLFGMRASHKWGGRLWKPHYYTERENNTPKNPNTSYGNSLVQSAQPQNAPHIGNKHAWMIDIWPSIMRILSSVRSGTE